jgi:hypothetical protein
MSRKTTILTLVVLVGLAGACAKQEQASPAEEVWSILVEAWNGLETPLEKTTLAENYLAEFPDTEHSGSMAEVVVYYRGHEMEDPQGAYDIVASVFELIKDPEQRFEVGMELLGLSDSVEVPLELAQLANSLGAHRPLTYSEHQQVFETAIDLEEWMVADEHSLAALEMATPEAYRANYPDREFTDEDVAERVQTRKATALAYDGWALYNMGDTELAFARFAAADDLGSVSYLGVPNTPLFSFWGRAALGEGDLDSAVELLGAEAAFGNDGSAAEVYLREAFVAKNGDEEGFEEFLWATRSELATTIDDFRLLDYEGNEISMANVSTGKVTLLAFWFPT